MIPQTAAPDKTASLLAALDQLRAFVVRAAADGASFHDFESSLWQRVLGLGNQAVALFLDLQGTGDLGPTLALPDDEQARRLPELHARELTCVFGTFTLQRTCYGSRAGQAITCVPLDQRLALPAGKFSHLLQDWDLLLATEHPFAQVTNFLERLLGLRQHVDSLERLSRQVADTVAPFRQALPPPPPAAEGELLVQTADGKGIPMRRPADAPAIADHDRKRGPKKDRKRKAIVGAVYTVDRYVRTPEQVLEALFRQPEAERPTAARPRPAHKRVCVRLNEYIDEQGQAHDGVVEVFWWLAEQGRDRNPEHTREVISLFDGEEQLWEAAAAFQPVSARASRTGILDLLHVTPRLWQAARLFHPPDSAAALAMVRDRVLRVLRGEVAMVVRGLRQMGGKHGLKGQKRKALATICGYLEKNAERMRYDAYLAQGYPIASGVIEGACRHYVKDRMERTGMSWVKAGAQAMLELRSTALNGDWEEFMTFRSEHETQRLYPHRHTLDSISWPLAL